MLNKIKYVKIIAKKFGGIKKSCNFASQLKNKSN